jgi:hypothetical protein
MAPWTKVILLVALLAAAVMAAPNGTAAEPEPEETPDQIDARQQKERDERDAETPSASTTASKALDLDKMSAGDATGDKSTNAQNSKKMEAKGLKVKSGTSSLLGAGNALYTFVVCRLSRQALLSPLPFRPKVHPWEVRIQHQCSPAV